MITLDGSVGEGGGQILRTALSLSIITGQAFAIENVRARRARPGLQRQHLAAVNAAAAICSAQVSGAGIHSQTLHFRPQRVTPGNYSFDIGSAGSTTLVLQTILPPLMIADTHSSVLIEGGTHNPMAPPFEFLDRVFLPLICRMGPQVQAKLESCGFYPAGGGRIRITIEPQKPLQPLTLHDRGALKACSATAIIANLPQQIAERELAILMRELALTPNQVRIENVPARSPANVLFVEVQHENITELFVELGERGVRAETVASRLSANVQRYLKGSAPVDEHLADQLLLPLSLAGGGSFITSLISGHTRTNIEVIQRFLPVEIRSSLAEVSHRVEIGKRDR